MKITIEIDTTDDIAWRQRLGAFFGLFPEAAPTQTAPAAQADEPKKAAPAKAKPAPAAPVTKAAAAPPPEEPAADAEPPPPVVKELAPTQVDPPVKPAKAKAAAAAPAGAVVDLPDAIRNTDKMREFIMYLHDEAGLKTADEIVAAAVALKSTVPMLGKIANVDERVRRALVVLGYADEEQPAA